MTNPYDPQSPAKPHYFGGRREVIHVFQERIEKASKQKQSGGLLVFGYRGVGKTSLLRKLKSIVSSEENPLYSNILAVYRRLSKTTSDSELYQILHEDIAEEVRHRKSLLEKVVGASQNLKSAKIFEFEFNVTDSSPRSPYHQWRNLVKNIKNADCIVIALDDADFLSVEALGDLKTIVEEDNPTPILLIVSGGVEFESKLVDEYSPIARIFSGASFNIGEFTLDETKEVLSKPVENTDTSWSKTGISEVQKLSRGYPYLVQCLANASYSPNTIVDDKKVNSSLQAALKIGSPWLNNEIKTASDVDIKCFMKITENLSDTFTSSQMNALDISPPYIGRLVQKKIINQLSRGRYKLNKPPIVGLYHYLKRGLEKEEIKQQQKQTKIV